MSNSKLFDEIGPFVSVPNWMVERGEEIGYMGLALLLCLRYYANFPSIFPSYNTIQRLTGLNRHQIAKTIRHLESLGMIERQKRFGHTTIYRVKNLYTPNSSVESALLTEDNNTVVQNQHQSSAELTPSLVQNQHTIKNHLSRSSNKELKKDDDVDERLITLAREYERTFGLLMTPTQGDVLISWCEDYPLEWVQAALKKTALNNGKTLSYTQKILQDMRKNGKNRKRAPLDRGSDYYLDDPYSQFTEH